MCKTCSNKKSAQWRKDNSTQVKKYYQQYWPEYYLKNTDHYMIKARVRKQDIAKAIPNWLTKDQLEEISAIYKRARESSQTVDHIIPLKGKDVCGLHVPWNLQVLSLKENLSKGIKWQQSQSS